MSLGTVLVVGYIIARGRFGREFIAISNGRIKQKVVERLLRLQARPLRVII